jgi:hypothetical protein
LARIPALAAFVQQRFGVPVQLRERIVVVTAAGVTLVGGNPNRLALLLINHGALYATVTTQQPGAIDQGIRLDPGGGGAAFDPETDGEGVGYPMRAFSSGADVNVAVWETIALGQTEVP